MKDKLTERQIQILELLKEKLTRPQTAVKLGITENTLNVHLKNAYKRLNAANLKQALKKAKI